MITINEIVSESSDNISGAFKRINKVYGEVVDNLGLQDLGKLKKTKKQLNKLEKEVDALKSEVFYLVLPLS